MSDFFKADADAVEVVQREHCFRGFYRLDRLHLRHRQFKGGMGPLISRELFVRHDAVCVLPYDPLRDEVVLIEQFRVGALGKKTSPWLLELVAGLIEEGEQPEQVAHREALEEADLTLDRLWPITEYFPSPGGSDERVHLYPGSAAPAPPPPPPVGCTAWPRKARTSACMCCPTRTPCARSRTA